MTTGYCGKTYRGAFAETWICATKNDPTKADDYGRCPACEDKFGPCVAPRQPYPYKGSLGEFIDNYKAVKLTLGQRVKSLFKRGTK